MKLSEQVPAPGQDQRQQVPQPQAATPAGQPQPPQGGQQQPTASPQVQKKQQGIQKRAQTIADLTKQQKMDQVSVLDQQKKELMSQTNAPGQGQAQPGQPGQQQQGTPGIAQGNQKMYMKNIKKGRSYAELTSLKKVDEAYPGPVQVCADKIREAGLMGEKADEFARNWFHEQKRGYNRSMIKDLMLFSENSFAKRVAEKLEMLSTYDQTVDESKKPRKLTKKEASMIDRYRSALGKASDLLDENQGLFKRPVDQQPGNATKNSRDEINAEDDLTALKNKTILKHLGFEVGKDDEIERAGRIISKFEKIIPKLKQAMQTLRHRLVQKEMGSELKTDRSRREVEDEKEKARKRDVAAMIADRR